MTVPFEPYGQPSGWILPSWVAPPKPVPPHFSWTRGDMFVGECQACRRVGHRLEDMRFEAFVVQDSSISGWQLRIVTGGKVIHLSEHGSRIAACRAADRALARAIALRSVDIEPRRP